MLKKRLYFDGIKFRSVWKGSSSFPGPFKRCFICNLDVIGCEFYLAEYGRMVHSSKANSEQNSEWYTIHRNVKTHPYFAAWNIHSNDFLAKMLVFIRTKSVCIYTCCAKKYVKMGYCEIAVITHHDVEKMVECVLMAFSFYYANKGNIVPYLYRSYT